MPGFLERNHLEDLYDDLACVTRTYFTDLYCANYELPADIESLLDNIEADRDVIVNFNWDEEVDGYLNENRDIQYTLGCCGDADEVLILRPHGPIGWYDVGRGIANKESRQNNLTNL